MKMIFKLAWRNLWRNKRRTTISISSVMFGAFFCIVMVSFMDGSMGYMVNRIVERETGHFQVMDADYWNDRTIDHFIEVNEKQLAQFAAHPLVKFVIPRAETFSVAWNGTKTRPVSFNGINPRREASVSTLDGRVTEGRYLSECDSGILVATKLAQSMNLRVGDTLTLIGQGYQGSSAAGLFPVRGIFKAFDPLSDGRLIYTSIHRLQEYIGRTNGISGVAIVLHDSRDIPEVIAEFKALMSHQEYEYLAWQELLRKSAAGMMSDKESLSIFFYVLYVIVAFGLLGTVIMMTNERMKEFGVMTALGTRRGHIVWSLFVEMCLVGVLGVVLASVLALPLVAYFHYYPLVIPVREFAEMIGEFGLDNYLPFALEARIFINQMLIVVVIAMLCAIYPWRKIRRMKIMNALNK